MVRAPGSADPGVAPGTLGLTAGPVLLPPGNLWYRQGVTPSYPQGSSWEHVSNNVCRVSVGPLDQVGCLGDGGRKFALGSGPGFPLWCPHCHPHGASTAQRVCFQVWVIANKVQGSRSLSRGTVCHRTGVQPLDPKGQGWDYGIGVSRQVGQSRTGRGWGATLRAWAPRGARQSPSGLWRGGLCPRPPAAPVTWLSPSRGAGITSLSGPMPQEPSGARPSRQLGSRALPAGPCRRLWALSAAEPSALPWKEAVSA